jgi:DNA-binding response OmpR family regulator
MSPAPADGGSALAFGEFVLDVANARLSRAGQPLALTPKPFALLAELVQRR